MRNLVKLLVCSSFLFCFAVFAQAHKVNIFATLDGNMIVGKVYFSGGGMAENVEVSVLSMEGLKISTISTNGKGEFLFAPTAKDTQYTFSVDTGDGHAAKTTVAVGGAALTGGSGPAKQRPPSLGQLQTRSGEVVATAISGAAVQKFTIDTELIAGIVSVELSKQLRPLSERIDRCSSTLRITDILGGLGYIAGIFGVIAFIQARRLVAKGKDKENSGK